MRRPTTEGGATGVIVRFTLMFHGTKDDASGITPIVQIVGVLPDRSKAT